jgi:dTMP kinase
MGKKKQGKFIVIDGTDGSGKATQTKLLVKKLKKGGYNVKTIDFPQYEKNFFGKMVGRYLAGEFGNSGNVSPYLASILYAADRFESSKVIKKWISEGCIVIADRYASSNQIHQGGKIYNDKRRKEFLDWLEEMEFKVFKIPRPVAIIYLDVPIDFSFKLLENKSAKNRKKYLNGKKDIHESDVRHLQDAKNSAMKLIKKNNNWIKIDCVKNGKLMSIKEIHEIVWNKLKGKLI